MANRTDDLIEANKRGLLSGQAKTNFDEAVKRGLITLPQQEAQDVNIPSGVDSGVLPDNSLDTGQLATPQPASIDAQPVQEPTVTGEIIGGLDTAKTIASAAIAEPVAGIIGGIETGGRAILNALGFDAGDPTGEGTKTISAVRDFITLEPSTEEGQRNLQVIGGLVEKGVDVANFSASGLVAISDILSGQGAEKAAESVKQVQTKGLSSVLGQRTLDATGSPAAAAIVHSLPTAAIELFAFKGLRNSKLANEKLSPNIAEAIQQAAPDIKQIQAAKTAAYKELDEFGVKIKSQVYDNFADSINKTLTKEGVDPTLTPKSSAVLKRIMEEKGSPKTLSELDTIRKIAKGAANDIDKTDARLGNIIINKLDTGIDSLSTQIGGKFKEARGLAQRAFKSQDIADMMENASHTASGLENGLRIEARKILKNKKRRKGFSADEIAALRKIEQGTTLGNLTKFLGKFGISEGQATSMVGASFGAGGGGIIGSMFGGPAGGVLGAVGVPALGQIAKKTSQRITLNNTKFADDLVRAGKNSEEVTKAYLKNTPISERRVSDLTDLLMDPNITGGDVTRLIKGNTPTSKLLSDSLFFVTEIKRRLKQGAATAAILQPDLEQEANNVQ